LLAYAATLPVVAGAFLYLFVPSLRTQALGGTIIFASLLLCFFAGVRRGLSFRQPGGARASQILTMLWLFVAGLAAALSPWPLPALLLLVLGFASLMVLDRIAARRDEVPAYFGRLRSTQLLIPIVSLAAILARLVTFD